MKSEKGITLTSLVIYIVLLMLVVSFLSLVSSKFYSKTEYLKDANKYSSEYNKFNMYFIEDVKNNNNIYSISEDNKQIVFEDGTMYTYSNQSIYRNKVKICDNVKFCAFTKREETDQNNFTKIIINVNMKINANPEFETQNDYTLKYW